jgi:hypothetical protein
LRRGRLRSLAAPRFHTRKNEVCLPRSEGAPEMGEGGETRLNRGIGSHPREGEGDAGGRVIKRIMSHMKQIIFVAKCQIKVYTKIYK